MKTLLSIKREFNRANRALALSGGAGRSRSPQVELRGVRQALAWVLDDNSDSDGKVTSPVLACGLTARISKKELTHAK